MIAILLCNFAEIMFSTFDKYDNFYMNLIIVTVDV